jgi:hypothetical protein
MNKKIIKNKNCNLEIEGKEKFKIKIKDKEILNYYFYLNSTSFISKEEAKELLEFNKELSGNFPEIKIYLENDFTVIKFLNYKIFLSEVVILEKFKNETVHITFKENIEKIKEKDLPKLNSKFQVKDFTVSFGKYWLESDLDIENPSFSFEFGCEWNENIGYAKKFKFYLNQMSYKIVSSPKFKTFVKIIELSNKYIYMEEFFKKYFSIK